MLARGEVALLGTGVAALAAAARLAAEGRSVYLINPEWDFFSEDSELSFDPLLPSQTNEFTIERIQSQLADRTHQELSPVFPGAVEVWPFAGQTGEEFHDPTAPYIRERTRLWIQSNNPSDRVLTAKEWEQVEHLYVSASDAGLNPQIFSGLIAQKKFPGMGQAVASESMRAVMLPRMTDVDVSRYRYGLLEYIRDRLGADRIVCGASQIELFQEGIRFHVGGAAQSFQINELLVFWTPRLTQWVLAQAKRVESKPVMPLGVRLWEEWRLNSRDSIDPQVIGIYNDLAVWAELEGVPDPLIPKNILSVLRSGPLVDVLSLDRAWVSQDSFSAISKLCQDILGWDRFSIRSIKNRAIFEWADSSHWGFNVGNVASKVISRCDGPLLDVVTSARKACEGLR